MLRLDQKRSVADKARKNQQCVIKMDGKRIILPAETSKTLIRSVKLLQEPNPDCTPRSSFSAAWMLKKYQHADHSYPAARVGDRYTEVYNASLLHTTLRAKSIVSRVALADTDGFILGSPLAASPPDKG